jgi:hypothetical protein
LIGISITAFFLLKTFVCCGIFNMTIVISFVLIRVVIYYLIRVSRELISHVNHLLEDVVQAARS